ncbi:Flagellar biosynthesis protein FlhA [Caulifigura coniformis]|uniref:Flagellar biosynthesis protein FlhA n=1 Tax=Caulifigura coniformis TaxID=2527983 RepID=A0A517S8V2_9PLAN|nr:flagellar biosynthesis protein FlhA [Caulifigura coniformis]QDT52567.1 Flagellar biosynthesis protein FlhA [Caulifigura coniformis]
MSHPHRARHIAGSLHWLVPGLLVASLLAVFCPVPPGVLDVMLAANIAISLVMLLTAIYTPSPLDLSMFPTLLLATALGRVILNFASTRLILTRGHEAGIDAAGGVIRSFGEFVAGGDPAVGFILFLILVVIQFVVVTKGATRIGEVAARFALDGMPGRQMAVDADLTHGVISADQAAQRRRRITQEADFYGAMDGAGKFIRGDAVAGLVITAVNIVGGLVIGVVEHGMTVAESASVFSVLTIGDGLVSQVPAFLVSVAAGLMMTRTSDEADVPNDTVRQLGRHRETFVVSAVFLAGLALTGLPAVPLLGMSALCCLIAWNASPRNASPATPPATEAAPAAVPSTSPTDALQLEPLELELGVGLIRLADRMQGGDLGDRVVQLRNRIAQDLGFILPRVRIHDNLNLDPRHYRILMRGVPVASGEAYADGLWAAKDGHDQVVIQGVEAIDPVTGRSGWWIEPEQKEQARALGLRVEEPSSRVIRHLAQVVRTHSEELLTRQHVHELLNNLRLQSPKLVDEVVQERATTATIHRVLCGLLRERVPIRDLETIIEALGDSRSSEANELIEQTRLALRRTICQQYRDESRRLHAVVLDSDVEHELCQWASGPASSRKRAPVEWMRPIAEALTRLVHSGRPPVVVAAPELRMELRRALAAGLPQVAVLSRLELTNETDLCVAATVSPALSHAAG